MFKENDEIKKDKIQMFKQNNKIKNDKIQIFIEKDKNIKYKSLLKR